MHTICIKGMVTLELGTDQSDTVYCTVNLQTQNITWKPNASYQQYTVSQKWVPVLFCE